MRFERKEAAARNLPSGRAIAGASARMAPVRSMRVSRWVWIVALLFGCGEPATPATPGATLEDIDRDLAASCSGSKGVTDCTPDKLCKTAATWKSGGCEALTKNRRALSDRWLKAIEVNSWPVAYGLAYLEIDSALPALRNKLVGSPDRYGWDDLPEDGQYPKAMALVIAIEALSHQRAAAYVALTADERDRLDREASAGDARAAAADWLRQKLKR
jgi:hypothetical protein